MDLKGDGSRSVSGLGCPDQLECKVAVLVNDDASWSLFDISPRGHLKTSRSNTINDIDFEGYLKSEVIPQTFKSLF